MSQDGEGETMSRGSHVAVVLAPLRDAGAWAGGWRSGEGGGGGGGRGREGGGGGGGRVRGRGSGGRGGGGWGGRRKSQGPEILG